MSKTAITRRLAALESKTGTGQSALVQVPKDWTAEQRQSALDAFRADAGLHSGVQIDVMECSTAADLEVLFVGCWAELLDHVRKHGDRIGDAPAIATKS